MKKNLIFLLLAISIILLSLIKNSFISFFDTNSKDILTFEKIPKFSSKSLFEDNKVLTDTDIINKITIINFFASWCIPCKAEHDLLMSLKKKFPDLNIIGFNHKDKKEDALEFLITSGNPYSYVGVDNKGKIALEFGVFGLPETFLTNKEGLIVYKHAGPLSNKIIKKEIVPNL